MIVNMYVDHLMATPPASAEEVWNATRMHAKLFDDAAARIGMTRAEFREFQTALLDGKAGYVKLPRKVDAMSGSRRGSVYAVHNAVMTSTVMGWRVPLRDGNIVYVPQVCGNISLLRPVHVAHVSPPKRVAAVTHHPAYHPTFHPAIARIPAEVPETPVTMEAPVVQTPVEVPAAAPVVAQVVPAVASGGSGFLFFIPVALGAAIYGATHGHPSDSPPAAPPPCAAGSNAQGVCFGH